MNCKYNTCTFCGEEINFPVAIYNNNEYHHYCLAKILTDKK